MRDTHGGLLRFVPCTGNCWAWPTGDNANTRDRLERTNSGYHLEQAHGQHLYFEDPWATVAGTIDRYFLTRIVSSAGDTVASLTYAAPSGLTCPTGQSGTGSGVPYVSQVLADDGTRLVFTYTRPGGATQCVLTEVGRSSANDDGGSTTAAVTFTYATTAPGLVASATYGNGDAETYSYSSTEFLQSRADNYVVRHVIGSAGTRQEETIDEAFSVYDGGTVACLSGSQCCGRSPFVRLTPSASAGAGNGTTSNPGLITEYQILPSPGQLVTQRPYRIVDTCTVSGSCSPGSTQSEWTCDSADGGRGYELANKDKRDNWTAFTWANADAGSGAMTLEKRSEKRGATAMSGTGALEEERFSYVYGANGQQLIATRERDSVLSTGEVSGTKSLYDGNNRLKGTIRYGRTRNVVGTVSTAYIGTFSFDCPSPSGGVCSTGIDPLGRTLATHGPCWVQGLTSTDCDVDALFPITRYSYNAAGSGNDANRLHTVSRYPNGTSGTALVATYGAYDARGNATTITDENSVTETLTYEEDRVASRTVGSATTSYVYAGGQLASTHYPDGNYDVFCYRSGTSGGCTGGTPTSQLQWKAKAANASGSDWSEKAVFTYWPDGTLASESTWSLAPGGSAELRRVKHYAADAHRRPTWERTGEDADGGFVATKAYDRADNLAGIGQPYNNPPAWCGGPASGAPDSPESRLCTWLGYDRANRLRSVIEHPEPGNSAESAAIKTCFGHDGHGNLTKVVSGCQTSESCTDSNGELNSNLPSSCLAMAIEYQHDDFGNVVVVTQPNTGTGTDRGQVRYEYDAMGNATKKELEATYVIGAFGYTYVYDQLGRPTEAWYHDYYGNQFLYLLEYDGASSPPSGCPSTSNTLGRLSLRTDSGGWTWYSYDSKGRVAKEVRVREQFCTSSHGELTPHTEYSYTANGNLASIVYPHGRTIRYGYYSGNGREDRVQKISVDTWDGTSWATQDIVTGVQWEPYGGVRAYQVDSPVDAGVRSVENLQGGNGGATPAANCGVGRPSGGEDLTGRLRAIWVSDAGLSASESSRSGSIYKRTYTWAADQVQTQDTCLLTNSSSHSPRREEYTYDPLLRLTAATRPTGNFAATGGAFASRAYQYEARHNRTDGGEAADGTDFVYTYDSAPRTDQLVSRETTAGASSIFKNTYFFEQNGRVLEKKWPNDSSGSENGRLLFRFDPVLGGPMGGGDSVYKAVNVNNSSGWYGYYYDAYNRRRAKVYPTSVSDEFFYDTGHQLLEDRGNYSLTTAADYPIDEYVWLEGRPIAFMRAKFDSSWARQPDFAGSCQRNGESTPCGLYFIVTDHLAKPVLLLDSALRVAGAADYEPFGYPNRVTKVADTAHPYSADQAAVVLASFTQPRGPNALVRLKAKFHFVDTEACGATAYDYAFLTDSSAADLGAAKIAGYKQGPGWSEWVSVPSDGQVDVRFTSNSENLCPDGNGCVTSNYCYWGWDYKGVVVEGYEYQRYESTSSPAWLALRFPGQYYDPETDLFENWNRYYDPSGRYLSPEPMLQSPEYISGMAKSGMSVPAYAYAFNNPLYFTDPTGLYGTASCDYYTRRCAESGGDYYCKQAPYWCNKFPKPPDPDPSRDDDYEGWPRCTRQCLQECDEKENKDQNQCSAKPDDRKGPWDPRSSSFDCHQRCYRWCGLDPTYPRLNWPHQRPF